MTRIYRLALHLLPADLRDTHGTAMEQLFARELAHARERGLAPATLAGVAGVWDVLKRSAYERGRPSPHATGPQPTPAHLLRRLAASFAIAFAGLTAWLIFLYASRHIPVLNARGVSAGGIAQFLLLATPFTSAMTIPMAVFLAVLHEFSRLGARGALAALSDVRRLVVTVLATAVGVAALSLVLTAEIVPRTNLRLDGVLRSAEALHTDRTMTIGELREAVRGLALRPDPVNLSRAAAYEVEIQKKFALPAACLVLALVAMAIAFRFPRGGTWLVVGASFAVFSAYYVLLLTGESLAERLVVSPVVGMWGTNAFLLSIALLAVWRRRERAAVLR